MKIVTLNTWGKYGPYQERWKVLLEELIWLKPDVICFQEVQDNTLIDQVKKSLSLPYASFAYEAGLVTIGRFPFFRENILKYKATTQIEKEDRRAILVGLSVGLTQILIANTHLTWRLEDESIRLKQVQELLRAVQKESYPALLIGDFNDNPQSKPIQEIKEKGYCNLLELASPNGLRITWDNQNPFIQTHSIQFPDREIDFIFADQEFLRLNPLKTGKLVFNRRDPKAIYPSDHYGVFVEVGDEN